jgi:transcriptional regulator GlxA family with amidase domain
VSRTDIRKAVRRALAAAVPRRAEDLRTFSIPPPSSLIRRSRDPRIRIILERVAEHPSPSVHDLAAHIGLSRSRLEHVFKSETGRSLKTFLLAYRLLCSAMLLLVRRLRIREIAVRTGYSCGQSFARSFHDFYGMDPRTYRKRMLTDRMRERRAGGGHKAKRCRGRIAFSTR